MKAGAKSSPQRIQKALSVLCLCVLSAVCGESQTKTTISDTLRFADGSLASGRIELSWPALKTADGFTITAGRLNYTVSAGVVNLAVVPNAGATPSGTSYGAKYFFTNGTSLTEIWIVPATGPVTVAAIRSTVAPTPTVAIGIGQLPSGTANQLYKTNAAATAAEFATLSVGTAGTDFNVAFGTGTITLNLPDASATARGAVTTGAQTWAGTKTFSSPLLASSSTSTLGSATSPFGALYVLGSSGTTQTTFQATSSGLYQQTADPLGGISAERIALQLEAYPSGRQTDPGFTNEEALRIIQVSLGGQNDIDQVAKKTFFSAAHQSTHYGAGQRFITQNTQNCFGMGDCFISSDFITMFGGVNASGDEGTALHDITIRQGQFLATASLTTVPAQTTCNTTLTQAVTPSASAQTVTVASTTGCNVADWVTVDRGAADGGAPPAGDNKIEAVKLTAVGTGTISGVFLKSHSSGGTVTPATKLFVSSPYGMGQFRYLVNLTATPYTAGTVASIASRTYTGSGTTWTNGMVGGDSVLPGCVALAADDFTATPFSVGSPLRSWYVINSVASATSLSIAHRSAVGTVAYSGNGPGAGTYTIRPCARILAFDLGAGPQTAISNWVILENNSFTWTAGNSVEAVFSTNADVSGELFRVAWYQPGGSLRTVYQAANTGGQTFGSAFSATQTMVGSVTTGFSTGLDLTGAVVGTGIGIPAATTGVGISLATSSTSNNQIKWTPGGGIYQDNATGNLVLARLIAGGGGDTRLALSTPDGLNEGIATLTARNLSVQTLSGSPQSPSISLANLSGKTWQIRNVGVGLGGQALQLYNLTNAYTVLEVNDNSNVVINSLAGATAANTNSSALHWYMYDSTATGQRVQARAVPVGTSFEWQLDTATLVGAFANRFGMSATGKLHFGLTNHVTIDPTGLTAARTLTIPDANSNPVQPSSAPSNQFATGISSAGVISYAQPAFSNLSGSAACAQLPALTGDVTTSAGSCATTVANITTGATMAGNLLATNIAAPATPAVGKTYLYVDSTQKVFSAKNDAGTVSITVVPSSAPANQFATGISAVGVISYAQPAFSNLSGSLALSQTPLTTRGDILTVNATPALARLALGGSNLYLKSNGLDVVYSTLAAGGVGSCTNQAVTALNADAAPTCTTITSAYTDSSIDTTGTAQTISATKTFTAIQDFRQDAIATTATDAAEVRNTTASTAVATLQYSPALRFTGAAWDTGALASKSQDWREFIIPTSANPTTNKLSWQSSIGGAAFAEQAFLGSGGIFSATSGYQVNGASATAGNVLRGDGTKFVGAALAAADLSNGVTGSGAVVLASAPNFTAAPTITGFTNGSVVFYNSGLAQNNANFYWDNTNVTFGVGTTRTGAISTTNPRMLVVGANNTTNAILMAQRADGSQRFYVREDGIAGMGTAISSGAPSAGFEFTNVFSAGTGAGLQVGSTVTGTAGDAYGFNFNGTLSASNGAVEAAFRTRPAITLATTGNTVYGFGFYNPTIDVTGAGGGSTYLAGARFQVPAGGTTNTGLAIDGVPTTGGPYSIYDVSSSTAYFTSPLDATAAASTRPIKAGTAAVTPATCTANKDFYVKTDATPAGQQLFLCNSAGTGWNLVGDGGAGGANHNILSATHSDSTAAAVVRGDLITGQGVTPTWSRLALGTSGQVIRSNGTDALWAQLASTDLSDSASIVLTTGAQTISGVKTFTGAPNFRKDAIATTATDSQVNDNTTAATAAATLQYSPALRFTGHAWDTAGAGADKSQDWRAYIIPTSGNPTTNKLSIQGSIGGAAFAEQAFLGSGGIFSATSGYQVNGAVAAAGNVLRGDGTKFVGAALAAADLSNGVTGSGAVVLAASPSLTTPSFSSIVNIGTLTLPTSTDTLTGRATTDTLTNKTLDAEAAGNLISEPSKIDFVAAGCDNAAASSTFDLPTANGPAKTCFGTSPHRFGALDFADGASALTASIRYLLPSDWTATGGVDIKFIWFSGSVSTVSVVWTVQTVCVADGEDVLNPIYNAVQTVADANNATANTRNSASIAGITMTGCAAGEMLHLKVGRDPTNASDTLAATASLMSVELTIRRQM